MRGLKILVVGGTGQTGPLVVQGLLQRGAEVTILHSGRHEGELPPVEHLHADVHFREPLDAVLAGRTFDVVVCMYGRARVVAEAVVGKTTRLVSVSGTTYAYTDPTQAGWGPFGVTVSRESSPFSCDPQLDRIGAKVWETEQALLQHHERGDYAVTILRFPEIYGPQSIMPNDWSIVRRILDRRPYMLIADGGLRIRSRAYRDNAAHATLLAIEHARAAAGQIYNVADEPPVPSMGQIIQRMAAALGHEWQLIDAPFWLVNRLYRSLFGFHRVLDISKLQDELGYRAPVALDVAIERSVQWWAEHRPEPGGEIEQKLGDRFDYATEDEIIRRYQGAMREIAEMRFESATKAHPYAHPSAEGQGWSAGAGQSLMNRSEAYPFRLWRP